MCLVALFFRVVEDAPIVVGANREEYYVRQGEPPRLLDWSCRVVAGVDPRQGGTWIGVNERSVLIAVTNRRKTKTPTDARSRGLLARDLLGCPSAAAAQELATRELSQDRYAGCNVFCADAERAVVLHGGDWLRIRPLPPGVHVLANDDINDGSEPRVGHAMWWLHERTYDTAADCVAALRDLCSQSGPGSPAMCLNGFDRGTVSSSVIALNRTPSRSVYLHAQGPPDRTPFQDYSSILREMLTSATASGAASARR